MTQAIADKEEVPTEPSSHWRTPLSAAAAAALLEACGGGGGSGPATPGTATPVTPPVSDQVTFATDYAAARFLQHSQFSSSEAEIAAVKSMGASAWLDSQMSLPSSLGGWDWLAKQGYNAIDSNQFYQMDYQANFMAWNQIMAAPDGVRRRMALALSEFFVASISGVSTISWSQFAMGHYWDILCNNAFGNYRQLVEEVTLSIAMG